MDSAQMFGLDSNNMPHVKQIFPSPQDGMGLKARTNIFLKMPPKKPSCFQMKQVYTGLKE